MKVLYKNYLGCGFSHSCVGWADWGCGYNAYQPNCAPSNDSPIASNDLITGNQGQVITISTATLLSNDTDKNGDKLTITSVQSSTNGTVALVNGNVVFTPAPQYVGPASFTYTITDGKGGASTATVCMNLKAVNNIPDAVNDTIVATVPGKVTIDPATLLANDKDADGDKLIITNVQCPTNGIVALVNGKIEFTPTPGYSGSATFTYTVSDGKGGCDTATVCLTIPKVNVNPDAVNDAMNGNEDTPFVFLASTLLDNDTDANGDKLTVVSVQGAVNGRVEMVNGTVTFTPNANFYGPASFTYTISDGKGGTDTATVNLNICAVNDAPDAVDDGVFTTAQNTPISIEPATLLANDKDIDGDVITGVSLQDAKHGVVSFINNKVVFTPEVGYTGPASFTYTVTDGKGGYDSATVSLNIILPVNQAPIAQNDSIDGKEDTPVIIPVATLLANDSDPNGDSLTIISVQNPLHGVVNLVNGKVTFIPDSNYNGPASFTYTVSDGKGGQSTATVNLIINPVNDIPDAIDDAINGTEDIPVVIPVASLLFNDTDTDGDSLAIVSVQAPVNGLVTLLNGQITFTPNENYHGPASFTYTVSDGKGGFDTATVNLNIASVNDPVTISSGTASVSEEGLAGGIADTAGIQDFTNAKSITGNLQLSDVDGDAIVSIVSLSAPSGQLYSGGEVVTWYGEGTQTLTAVVGLEVVATLSIDNTGQYTFNLFKAIDHLDPSAEDIQAINFQVSASDGVYSSNAVLTVNIEDDAPTAQARVDDIAMIDSNIMITLDVSGSMNQQSGIASWTRLESAVKSIENLLDTYDSYGEVRVRLVTFSSVSNIVQERWLTVDEVKAELRQLQPSGATNYDSALGSAIEAYSSNGKLDGAQTVSYFFSDGNPNRGVGDDTQLSGALNADVADAGIQLTEQTEWRDFLNANQIKSFAIGMGTEITNPAALNPIAYDGQAQVALSGTIVTDFGQLDNVLSSTANNTSGQLISGGLLGSQSGVGADGGHVGSVSVEGVIYTFNIDTNSIITSGGQSAGLFDSSTSKLTVNLASGAHFVVDMNDGAYQYLVPPSIDGTIIERFDYTLIDRDGDTASSYVDVTVNKTSVTVGTTGGDTLLGVDRPDLLIGREGNDELSGGAGKDTLLGANGEDVITGGAGNDSLSGGLGADTFVWSLDDTNSVGVEVDTISDFDLVPNSDVLNLKDLLVDESSSASVLDNYLHFSFEQGSTVISISHDGGFVDNNVISSSNASIAAATDQQIVLANVNMTTGFASDAQLIQNLLNQQKLITD